MRALAAAGLLAVGSAAQGAEPPPADLADLSIDELMGIEVTSVSKRAEPLTESAAAVYVITADDLRRSGDRTIAEALRRVPGIQVARTGQSYAISARGFNSTSSDKLQVLLDGRSVYTPLFSGVFWDVLDTYLPDVERIEVIRGPGATLWGANAVNGVINIVTRRSQDTAGVDLTVRGGTQENAYGGARLGWKVGETGAMRLYAQARGDDNGVTPDEEESAEGMRNRQAGFRADFAPAERQTLMVSGDVYEGEAEGSTGESDLSGGNVMGRWEYAWSEGSRTSLQAYLDHSKREIPTLFGEKRDTWDFQVDHHLRLSDANEIVAGGGYRRSHDDTNESAAIVFDPPSRTIETWSAFVQDQVTLSPSVVLTLGSKFEDNDFTGFEVQPGARIGWKFADERFTWAAVSRAVRTPNRLDSDVAIFCPPPDGIPGACGPGLFRIGNPHLAPEKLVAYEWGFRAWSTASFSAEVALFYNRYRDLRSSELSPPFGRFANALHGDGMGGELDLAWQPSPSVQVRAFYGYLKLDIDRDSGGTDATTGGTVEGSSPRHSAGLVLDWTPTSRWSVDAFVRMVDDLPAMDVPAYAELNLTVLRRLGRGFEIGLLGENLLDDRHPEFGAEGPGRLDVQRQVLLQLRWTPR